MLDKKINYKNYYRDDQYNQNIDLFKNIFLNRKNIIDKYIKNPKKVLDIGCSNGLFLSLFKNSEKWGVEPSRIVQSTEYRVQRKINTYFEKAKLPENYFDLVIMNHILEHVKDVDLVLGKVNKILTKNGILFIDVPNAGSLGARILGKYWPYRLPREHTYQFTKENLSKYLKNNNFKILHWESRSGLFEFANPWVELWQSFVGLKKRFIYDLFNFPYSLLSTLLNLGDSMSFICKKT